MRSACAWHGDGPDPAVGSAGVSRPQSRFDGSDRQARGRLLKALGAGPLTSAEAASVMGVAAERASRLVQALVDDRLVVRSGSELRLP